MKIRSRRVLILAAALVTAIIAAAVKERHPLFGSKLFNTASEKDAPDEGLLKRAASLKSYAAAHNMDTGICFLVDMGLPSGSNRFFVYDLKNYKVISKGLVTHGRCRQLFLTGRKYGNEVGCGCTSLGKYKIGASYYGKFGRAYKLHGLDKGNSNAFKRFVVLHSHDCVPDTEVAIPICQSDGCPTVAPAYLRQLSTVIDNAKREVLLEIFDE